MRNPSAKTMQHIQLFTLGKRGLASTVLLVVLLAAITTGRTVSANSLPCPIGKQRESPSTFMKRLTYPIRIELMIQNRFYLDLAYESDDGTFRPRDDVPEPPAAAGFFEILPDHRFKTRFSDDPVGRHARYYLSNLNGHGIAWVRWSHFRWQPLPEGAAVRGHPLWPLAVFFYFQDHGFEARIGCWDWRDLMTLFGFLEVPEQDLIPNWINVEIESRKKKRGGK